MAKQIGSGPSSRRGSLYDDSRRPSLIINDEVSMAFDGGWRKLNGNLESNKYVFINLNI